MPHKIQMKKFTMNVYVVGTLLYVVYLFILPKTVAFLIPCLHAIGGDSFSWNQCHVTLALDRFMTLALLGMSTLLLLLYINKRFGAIKPIIATGAICAFITIVAYQLYIPQAETEMKKAPIQLESLRQ
jgi:hypothetical protein